MAGDWIKVEKATVTKIEVMRLAEILNIRPLEAFGLCFLFWSWCDSELKSAAVTQLSAKTLDNVVGHPGFTEALITVGWLRVREGSLEVPNFDRHLSQSAKTRSDAIARQKRSRKERGVTNSCDIPVTKRESINHDFKSLEKVLGEDVVFEGGSGGTSQKSVTNVTESCDKIDLDCRLAEEWIFFMRSKRLPNGQESAPAVAATMKALIVAGVDPERLRTEAKRKDRDFSETIWEFKKRLMPAKAKQGPMLTAERIALRRAAEAKGNTNGGN